MTIAFQGSECAIDMHKKYEAFKDHLLSNAVPYRDRIISIPSNPIIKPLTKPQLTRVQPQLHSVHAARCNPCSRQ